MYMYISTWHCHKYLSDFMRKSLSYICPLLALIQIFLSLVLRLPWINAMLFLLLVPSLGMASLPPLLPAKLMSGISFTSSCSLKVFLFPQGVQAESAFE